MPEILSKNAGYSAGNFHIKFRLKLRILYKTIVNLVLIFASHLEFCYFRIVTRICHSNWRQRQAILV